MKNEAIAMLPAGPGILERGVVLSPFTVVEKVAVVVRDEWDSLELIREALVAKERQLGVFLERAEREAWQAHEKAISLAGQLRMAREALAALGLTGGPDGDR